MLLYFVALRNKMVFITFKVDFITLLIDTLNPHITICGDNPGGAVSIVPYFSQ